MFPLILAVLAVASRLPTSCHALGSSWDELASIPLAPRQEHTTVALSQSGIGIVGGIIPNGNGTGFDTTDLVQLYDINNNTWSTAAALPIPLNHPNVAAVNDKIYVFGGLRAADDGAWRAIRDSWAYDPDKDEWQSIEPVPEGQQRGSATIGVHGNTIYLAGGMRTLVPGLGNEQDTVDIVSAFDTESQNWVPLPEAARKLPERRDHSGGAVVNGVLYVVGGRDRGQANVRNTVFALDLENLEKGWELKAGVMPTARGGLAAGAVGNKIYTFGGEGNNATGSSGIFNETEVYDTLSDSWERLDAMRFPRHGTSAVGLAGGVYIPGGGVSLGGSPVNTFDVFRPLF